MVTPPSEKGSVDAASGVATFGARLAPYSEAILPGASALPPEGFAALTNALEAVVGGGPRLNEIACETGTPLPAPLDVTKESPPATIGKGTLFLTKTAFSMMSAS